MTSVFSSIIPLFIIITIVIGIINKQNILKLFTEGVADGLKTVVKIFPYILAITLAISLLQQTGAMNYLLKPIQKMLVKLNVPEGIVPLMVFRPLSGGASTSVVMEIFKKYGPDSIEGKIASIIMGGTETTFYVVTLLYGSVKIKKNRGTLIAALAADMVAIIVAILLVTRINIL